MTPFTAESKVLFLRRLEKELNVSSIKLEGTATIIKSHEFRAVSILVVIAMFFLDLAYNSLNTSCFFFYF